jgi:branched-chain amino acid transport system ATP-binding protein
VALLEVRELTKCFGGLVACDHISFDVHEGEILGVIGPNGAGKTTLFNCIAGVCRADGGDARFKGEKILALRSHEIARRGIARTFQISAPFAEMTALENVMVGALTRKMSVSDAKQQALDCLQMVGLGEKWNSLGNALSTGQRKRLEMARAMALQPQLLLLDETTGGIDHKSIPDFVTLIKRLRQEGVTLIVIEHNVKVMLSVADRLIALHMGRRIADGTPEAVVTDPNVIRLYLGEEYVKGT